MNLEKIRIIAEGDEFTEQHIISYLASLAENEPMGTYANLEMLLRTGLLVDEIILSTSVKRVYVAEDDLPNAYTFRVLPIPFIGSDWIVINRSLIDLLDDDELRAVLTHELGHVKSKYSWVSLFYYAPRLVGLIILAILLVQMSIPVSETGFNSAGILNTAIILVVISLYHAFLRFSYSITRFTYNISELRADIYSVHANNAQSLVNAIYKIYQKSQVYLVLKGEMEFYKEKYPQLAGIHDNILIPDLPPGENSPTYAMMMVHGSMQRILTMYNIPAMSSGEIDELIEERRKLYQDVGIEYTGEIRGRVEFERNVKITADDFARLIMEVNNEQNEDPLFVRFRLISELIKENSNLRW